LLVRGLGARSLSGTEINLQLARELGDDFLEEGAFVHHDRTGKLVAQIDPYWNYESHVRI
jgi:hypothetical protein